MQETAARVLIGDSLGFHIFFVMIGIGLPLLISLFELFALRRNDAKLLAEVRRWTIAAAVFVVTGIVSGTLIAVQMALVWPQFMSITSRVVGPAFMFEGYFFLLEAAFLSWYVLSWGRIKGYAHWFIGLGTVIGSLGSAVVITLVNAWMNQPTGFRWEQGMPVNVNLPAALFTSTSFVTVFHSILSYLTTIALVVGGLYAIRYMRHKKTSDRSTARYLALRLAAVGLFMGGLTAVFGDLSAKNLAAVNPQKLAAYELQINTERNAAFRVGGEYNESTGRAEGAVEIPSLLSFLATGSASGEVEGLNETPRELWPPLVTHLLFDIKMFTAILTLVLPLGLLALEWPRLRRFKMLRNIAWRLLPVAGVAAFVTVELGWVMAELGRQPFAIYGILLTKNAFTQNPHILAFGYAFPILFVLLTIATGVALPAALKHARKKEERGTV